MNQQQRLCPDPVQQLCSQEGVVCNVDLARLNVDNCNNVQSYTQQVTVNIPERPCNPQPTVGSQRRSAFGYKTFSRYQI